MTTPTPPADAPTPRTDAVNECAKRLILNRPFGSSTADLLQELADLYSKHAESLERFLGSALANNDPLREKVIEFQRELAAKDARIAALEKDKNIDSARLAVALSDALLREFPHMVYGMRIPSHVPENAAAERAYHLGNFARFLASQIDAAREGQKS